MSDNIALIKKKIAAGHIVEAGTLLKLHPDTITGEQRTALQQAIAEVKAAADALMNQANAEEKKGNVEEGIRLLHQAEKIATDLPDLGTMLTRMHDTVALTRALKNRSLRRTQPLPPAKPARPTARTLKIACLLTTLLGISAWLIGNSPFSPLRQPEVIPPKKTATNLLKKIQVATSSPPQLEVTNIQRPSVKPPADETAKSPGSVSQVKEAPIPAAVISTKTSTTTTINGQQSLPLQKPVSVPRQQVGLLPPPSTSLPDKKTANTPPQARGTAETYVIQPGDTLSSIAHRLFCNEKEREKLYRMNKDRLAAPSSIYPGVEIKLETETITIVNLCNR